MAFDPNNPYTNMNDPYLMKALAGNDQMTLLPNAEMLVDPRYAIFQHPSQSGTIRDIIAQSRAANMGMLSSIGQNYMYNNPSSMMQGIMKYDPTQYNAVNNYWLRQQQDAFVPEAGASLAGMGVGSVLGNMALKRLGMAGMGGWLGFGASTIASGVAGMGVGIAADAIWQNTIGKQINEANTIRAMTGSHLTMAGSNSVGTGVDFSTAREMNKMVYQMRNANPYMSLKDVTSSFISGANQDLFNQGSADLTNIANKAKKVLDVTQNVLTFASDLNVDEIMKSLNKLQKMGLKVDDAQRYFEEANRISIQTGVSGSYLRNQIGQAGASLYQGMGLSAGTGAIEAMRAYGEADLMNKMGITSVRDLGMMGGLSGSAQQQTAFTAALSKKGTTQGKMLAAMTVGPDGKIKFDAEKYKRMSSTMTQNEMMEAGAKNTANWTSEQMATAYNLMPEAAETAQRNDPNYLRNELFSHIKDLIRQSPTDANGNSTMGPEEVIRILQSEYPEVSSNELRTVVNSIMGPNAMHYEAARLGNQARSQYNTTRGELLRKSQKGTLLQRAGRAISNVNANISNAVLDKATTWAAEGNLGQWGKDLLVGTTGEQERLEQVNSMTSEDIQRVMSKLNSPGDSVYASLGIGKVNTNVRGSARADMMDELAKVGIDKNNLGDTLTKIAEGAKLVSGSEHDTKMAYGKLLAAGFKNENIKKFLDKKLGGRDYSSLSETEKKQILTQGQFFENINPETQKRLLDQFDKNPNVVGDFLAKTISVGATSTDIDAQTAAASLQTSMLDIMNPDKDASGVVLASKKAAEILKGTGANIDDETIKNLVGQGKGKFITGAYDALSSGAPDALDKLTKSLKGLGLSGDDIKDIVEKSGGTISKDGTVVGGDISKAIHTLQEGGYSDSVVGKLFANADASKLQSLTQDQRDALSGLNTTQDQELQAKVSSEMDQLKESGAFTDEYSQKQLQQDLAAKSGDKDAAARVKKFIESGKGASLLGDKSVYANMTDEQARMRAAGQLLYNQADEKGKYEFTNNTAISQSSTKTGVGETNVADVLSKVLSGNSLRVIIEEDHTKGYNR